MSPRATDPAAPAERRVSIVVTCHNYGHFLGPCLDSALGQTRPPDEIVVVDDGSTDASPAVLDRYADRVLAIRTDKAGQAAAFNRGFEACSGDLVLFLDADDALKPEALETILLRWSEDMAHLVFGLEIVDEAGCSVGVHPTFRRWPDDDNRPELLRTGTFGFPPTSGNVFSRAMLEAAMPMPAARWRISADCYLIRAAGLFGRTGAIRRVLGSYRIHSANNYARLGVGAEDDGLRVSNRADIVDALDDLAAASDALLGVRPERVRAALRHRARAIRAELLGGDAPPFSLDPDVFRSRLLPILKFDVDYDLTSLALPSAGVLRLPPEMRISHAELDLRLPPATGPLSLVLDLDGPAGAGPVTVSVDGEPVARCGTGRGTVTASLPRAPFERDRRVRVVATASGVDPEAPRFTRLRIGTGRVARHHAVVPTGAMHAAGPILERGLDPAGWAIEDGGVVRLLGHTGRLGIAAPEAGRAILSLGLGAAPEPGWLSIAVDGVTSFHGRTGRAARLDLPLRLPASAEVALDLDFRPDGDGALRLEAIGLELEGAADRIHPGPTPIAVGEIVAFASHPYAGAFLGDGWAFDGASPPETCGPEACLRFRVSPGAADLALRLAVAPALDPPDGRTHRLGVSLADRLVARADLVGAGDLVVPIGAPPASGVVELTLHSIHSGRAGAVEDAPPMAAPLALRSVELQGEVETCDRPAPEPVLARPPHELCLARADRLLREPEGPARLTALADCRAELIGMIGEADVALALLLAGRAERLSRLIAIGRATRRREPSPAEAAPLADPSGKPSRAEALKRALVAILLRPAYRHPFTGRLARLPAPLLACPEALGAYFGEPPDLATAEDRARHRAYLETLLGEVNAALEEGPRLGRHYALAAAVLTRLRAVPAIFADSNLRGVVRSQSRAIERLLADGGAPLATARAVRPGVLRLRVGVLARDVTQTPEGWALRGMYRGLDRSRLQPILIRMQEGGEAADDVFERTVSLRGLSVDQAVRAIRRLELDLFVTGAYARDHEPVSAIYAHRLAPLQIWHGAVCPTTGGFGSFDAALSCRATEPADAQAHYTERLAWIEGPKQCAYAFGPAPAADRAAIRSGLGLDEGTVLLVSGAMAHKVDDALLGRWADILAGAPLAALALYPFPPNWSMAFSREAFEERLERAGLPPSRVVLLPMMPAARVRPLLAAADLYLDSFPYAGATTVCEALSVGTPVVTRAGRALRQLTGASWARAFGLDDLVAGSAAGYVRKATALATDPGALAAVQARCRAAAQADPPPHDDAAGFGAAYSEALWRLAEESGLFPGLGPPEEAAFVPAPARPAAPPIVRRPEARTLGILASPRTGSTLLCALLNRTPGVVCHFELFHRDMIQLSDRTLTEAAALAARNADPLGFLGKLRREASERGAHLVGFKHFAHLSDAVTDAIVADHGVRLIHLSRANVLAQYSSELIARTSGQWVRHPGRAAPRLEVPFDVAEFETFERYQRRVEADRVSRLAAAGRTVLFLEYAALVRPQTRARLSEFIGVTIPEEAQADIRKQNRPDIHNRFSEPGRVTAYLAGRDLMDWTREG